MYKLVKENVLKEGKEYTDLFLCWSYEGKEYKIRVKPVFAHEFKILLATASQE